MTYGVWLLPIVLVAAVVFLWAAAWFEALLFPPDHDAETHHLEVGDNSWAPADTYQATGVNDQRFTEPPSPAA